MFDNCIVDKRNSLSDSCINCSTLNNFKLDFEGIGTGNQLIVLIL